MDFKARVPHVTRGEFDDCPRVLMLKGTRLPEEAISEAFDPWHDAQDALDDEAADEIEAREKAAREKFNNNGSAR